MILKQTFCLLPPIMLLLTLSLIPEVMAGQKFITMATTTSTLASGLLDVILPEFEKETGIRVKALAKGTGAAIRDGMDGNVDLIFVHARQREEQFVSEGYGTRRYAVMHNDFVLLGPKNDPAGIDGCSQVIKALKKIAAKGATFVSRGDDSGTHTKEQQLWRETGLPLQVHSTTIIKKGTLKKITTSQPAGSWYLSIGQGMGKALTFADEKQTYILSDRATYLKYKYGRNKPITLDILCEGDTDLINEYGLIPVNPARFPHVRNDQAQQFVHWITSEKGQVLIDEYRLSGKQLFYPDVVK